jgi:phenylalanyl-tRNA synthetase alpha chain
MNAFDDVYLRSFMVISMTQVSQECGNAQSHHDLYQLKSYYLGKKGLISEQLKELKNIEPSLRKAYAENLNTLKSAVEKEITFHEHRLTLKKQEEILKKSCPDSSLPGSLSFSPRGAPHPIMTIQRELVGLFVKRGFDWSEGPDIETPFYNFEALNIPKDHPARQMHDTFYLKDGNLLRTHTSPVQIRYAHNNKPPFKMIAPGRVYRCDYDPTHTPMFHQLEGLVVAEQVSLAQLRQLLGDVLSEFFGQSLELRFRPSFFPFTDPSLEVDISCFACKGKGCSVCKHSTWIEVLGCGIVHPHVMTQMNLDPSVYQGYAFGLGIERLAMLKYQVPDLRFFFENHFDFLSQFSGVSSL